MKHCDEGDWVTEIESHPAGVRGLKRMYSMRVRTASSRTPQGCVG